MLHSIIKKTTYPSKRYGDTVFHNFEFPFKVSAETTFGHQKVESENTRFSANIVRVDKRSRVEFQLQTYSLNYRILDRINSEKWNRTELYFDILNLGSFINNLLEFKYIMQFGRGGAND